MCLPLWIYIHYHTLYYHARYGHCFTMSMLSFLYTLPLYGLMNFLFCQCYDLFKLTLPPDYFNTIRHHCPITRQRNIHVFILESYTFVACTTLPLCFTCKIFIMSVHPKKQTCSGCQYSLCCQQYNKIM